MMIDNSILEMLKRNGVNCTSEEVNSNGISNGFNYIAAGNNVNEQFTRCLNRYAIIFVREIMGLKQENGFRLSKQQIELLNITSDLAFAKNITWDARLAGKNESLPRSTRKLAQKLGISLLSGRGIGKTSATAMIVFWFLCTRGPNTKIVLCGPTANQINKVLMSEISRFYNMQKNDNYIFNQLYRKNIIIEKESIYWANCEANKTSDWSALIKIVSKTADPGVLSSKLSGLHAKNLIVIFDESCSIPDEVLAPLTHTLTGKCNMALAFSNPTRTSGWAYKSIYDASSADMWIGRTWSALDCDIPEIISPESIERLKLKYGVESDAWRVSVLGLPPTGEDSALIKYCWIQEAIDRDVGDQSKEKIVLGVDIALKSDETIAIVRQGLKILAAIKINKTTTQDISLNILHIANDYAADFICIDSNGIGAGVYDLVRQTFKSTYGVMTSASAIDKAKYTRLRDELAFKVREKFENNTISIPNNADLCEQISVIEYEIINGKVKIASKDDIRKKLGGQSCDYFDALCLTFYINDPNSKSFLSKSKESRWGKAFNSDNISNNKSWMSY